MPGHKVAHSSVENSALFDKYQCPHCRSLLKNAVQPLCGHWLCESCAEDLLASLTPKCPKSDCREKLKDDSDEGADYFPDRFVRREIEGLVVTCTYKNKGCEWKDKLPKFEAHLKSCEYASEDCPQCGETLTPDQLETHDRVCPKAVVQCPLAELGCSHSETMTRSELKAHVADHGVEHVTVIADVVKLLQKEQGKKMNKTDMSTTKVDNDVDDGFATGQLASRYGEVVERDGGLQKKGPSRVDTDLGYDTSSLPPAKTQYRTELQVNNVTPNPYEFAQPDLSELTGKLKIEVEGSMRAELRRKDEEIGILRNTITKLEKSMRSKHAEFEDRDFRLSLIENSNYDGSMVWKIPQFSQRMSDAQTGKYTSIFSLPFYTGRYGFKMCLRLYILGDGIGKNTHMSLFFVIMRGEFDSILQWPFTHKVTFKLINQTGGKDIIDTFQPDPMSSSFRKPKSDMNIASGCPRFVSHNDLKNGGFIVEDTVFIKCSVDCSNVKHP